MNKPVRFRYEALNAHGQRPRGDVDGSSGAEVASGPSSGGDRPTRSGSGANIAQSVSRAPVGTRASSPKSGSAQPPPRLADRDVELIFSQLAKMVTAGLSLERALVAVEQGAPGTPRAAVAAHIVKHMRAGVSPARAFQLDPRNFDPSTLALLRSGELTGDIGPALTEIERLMVARNQLRSKIRMALVYPAILGLVALGSVLTILLVVVPQFEELVRGHMERMPAAAQIVFWLSTTVRSLAWPIGLAGLVGLAFLLRAARSGGLERGVVRVVRMVPAGADLVAKAQSAALFRLLGTLVSRQVLLLPALDVARQTVGDATIGAAVDTVRARLKSGSRLAAAMAETQAFPPIAVQLARVGEETGDLGSMLTRAAQMLEDDLERTTKLFLIWFEPMLLVVIGTLIGGLLYGLFSAILSINTIV